MQTQRPIFLNLLQIRLPVMGMVSIFHRAAGVLMVLLIPALLLVLQTALSPEGYLRLATWLDATWLRLGLVLAVWALAHHFLAGLRFLLIDLEIGVSKSQGRLSAWIVHAGAVLVALLAFWRLMLP